MINAIKKILNSGGKIQVSYKQEINEWYSEISITKLKDDECGESLYVVHPIWIEFYDIDAAVNYFCDAAYTSKNKGYIQNRLIDKGLINDEMDLEKPNKQLKKLFEEEGKIVDEEFKSWNVVVKPLPKLEDATKEMNEMVTLTDVDELRNAVIQFKRKFAPLKIYINLSAKFLVKRENQEPHEFGSGFNLGSFTKEDLDIIKDLEDDEMEFQRFELCVQIANGDYNRFDLNV